MSECSAISIHALREEGDVSSCAKTPRPPIISIHALREEGDLSLSGSASTDARFLSTPSARRATASYQHFLPPVQISIHALREEGDLLVLVGIKHVDKFLSTPSARRATRPRRRPCRLHPNFYPRPPRGGRLIPFALRSRAISTFLSTPSARRATPPGLPDAADDGISIHALREEGDTERPKPTLSS